jgi:hypothetical protein
MTAPFGALPRKCYYYYYYVQSTPLYESMDNSRPSGRDENAGAGENKSVIGENRATQDESLEQNWEETEKAVNQITRMQDPERAAWKKPWNVIELKGEKLEDLLRPGFWNAEREEEERFRRRFEAAKRGECELWTPEEVYGEDMEIAEVMMEIEQKQRKDEQER